MNSILPGHDGKVSQLCNGHSYHESRGGVIGEHDRHQHEAPDEKSNAEQKPYQKEQFDLLASADDQ